MKQKNMRWLKTSQIFIKTSVTPKRLKLSLYDGVLSYSQISIILCEKTFFFLFYIGSELQKDICDLHFGGRATCTQWAREGFCWTFDYILTKNTK